MDENKIAFIICQTTEEPVEDLNQTLLRLNLPDGFKSETHFVGNENRCTAFNRAMKNDDAKYKIYLDDKTTIFNQNILIELIDIFQSDAKIGAIGCSGAIQLSTNGSSHMSAMRCGTMFVGNDKTKLMWGSKIDGRYREVEVLDGFLIATQYDVEWREDLFKQNSFGAAAQCLELRRRGYKCVAAAQSEPWVWYRSNSMPFHESCRKAFLAEYSKELFPLVQILIPTYNRPQFFKIALESALNQTYQNFEIIISDDSTNEETNAAVRPYLEKDSRIKYFRNPGFTANDNNDFLNKYQREHPEAEYFSWLFDDDMFYPPKLEYMVEAYRNNPDVSLVSSKRHNIDANGKIIGQMEPLHPKTEKLPGEEVGKHLLMYTANRIGEPSTVLLRKKFLVDEDKKHWRKRPNMIDKPNALGDYSQWLYLLEQGNIFWIDEFLSARRVHEGQDSQQTGTWVEIYINFAEEVNEFWRRKKFLKTDAELRHTIIVWLTKAAGALQTAFLKGYEGRETRMIEKVIPAMVNALQNGGNIKFPQWPKK